MHMEIDNVCSLVDSSMHACVPYKYINCFHDNIEQTTTPVHDRLSLLTKATKNNPKQY